MLAIRNLSVSVAGKPIVLGLSLSIKPGEIHVLMGPNGSGKTSLALALMGHPSYVIARTLSEVEGDVAISLDGKNLIPLSPDKRAKLGLFLSFQNPPAIEGVSVRQLLSTSGADIRPLLASLSLKSEFLDRNLNVGFSGGEKKKMEILQMLALKPKYIILDEIDSGLDVDSLKLICGIISGFKNSGILLITHNPRLFKYLTPGFVHVMKSGRLVKSGGRELIQIIEKEGYAKFN